MTLRHVRSTVASAATVALLATTLLAGCTSEASTEPQAEAAASAPAVMLAALPDGAVGVASAKPTAAAGDRIVLRGVIGGSGQPFVEGAPVFTIVDRAIDNCSDIPGDTCRKPWDYCCEPPDSLAANTATVQLVGADGARIAGDAAALGLKPNDVVVVVGTVAERPDPQVLIVNATGVHRVGPLVPRSEG